MFMIGAPVPTNSPICGNISVTSPSADAVSTVSLMYELTSLTAPLARLTKAAAASLSSRSAPFLAMSYCDFAARSVAMAALRCAVTSSSFWAVITPWS